MFSPLWVITVLRENSYIAGTDISYQWQLIVCWTTWTCSCQHKRHVRTSLYRVKSTGDRWFPSQMANDAESVPMSWRVRVSSYDMTWCRKVQPVSIFIRYHLNLQVPRQGLIILVSRTLAFPLPVLVGSCQLDNEARANISVPDGWLLKSQVSSNTDRDGGFSHWGASHDQHGHTWQTEFGFAQECGNSIADWRDVFMTVLHQGIDIISTEQSTGCFPTNDCWLICYHWHCVAVLMKGRISPSSWLLSLTTLSWRTTKVSWNT